MRTVRLLITATCISVGACASVQQDNTHSIDGFNMEQISIDGLSVNFQYVKKRDKSKPTLVLIHGFGASLESWNDIFPALSERYSVIRLDLRGHGLTDKPNDTNYSLEDQALLVSRFLKEMGIDRAVLIGHSYGGGVTLMTYLLGQRAGFGIPIEGLVLIDSAGYRQKFPFFVQAVENPALQFLSNLFPATLRAQVLLTRIFRVQSQVTQARVNQYARYFDLPGASHAIGQAARSLIPEDLDYWIAKYKDIDVPVLIIWGANDPVIRVATAEKFKADIPHAELVILDDTGHVPHEERPKEVLSTLLEFIGRLK